MTPPSKLAFLLGAAHHPLCGWFDDDVVLVGGLRVCAGCLAAWPAFLLALPGSAWLAFQGVDPWAQAVAGLALGLPQARSYVRRAGRLQRAASKVLGGVGLAFLSVGAALLPVPFAAKGIGFVALLVTFAGLAGVRMASIVRTCDRCPWNRDWDRCPGFLGHGAPAPPSP